MSEPSIATLHASAALFEGRGVLVRGASGAGKTRLVLDLVDDATARGRDGALIADDRVAVRVHHGRLVARVPAAIAGRVELRGLGIVDTPFEPAGVIALVVDVEDAPPPRMPEEETRFAEIAGVVLPRLRIWREDPRAVVRVRNALRGLAESP